MAVLEHRVSRLEEVLERFIERTEAAQAIAREEMAELRALQARTDREFLNLRRESELRQKNADERWKKFEQQADERQRNADERWIKFEQQADERQRNADERWKKFEQQAEKDRQQAEKDRQQADKARQQADKDRRDFNKRQAEISDRIGRFVEEMVHPNAARIAGQLFSDDPIETLAIRVKRRHPKDASRMIEIDLLVSGDRHLLIGEAKSTPTMEKSNDSLEKAAPVADFFPDYARHKVLPLLASVSFDSSLLAYLSRQKVYALGFGDNTMELLNKDAF